MNEKIEKIIEDIKSLGGAIGGRHVDHLTEEEIKYVIDKAVKGGTTMKAIAFQSIMTAKTRREAIKSNDKLTEINCECCRKVLPVEDFKYREDGAFARVCIICHNKLKEW